MEKIDNPIRRDILVSLKDKDKAQGAIRSDTQISYDNRSKLDYHLDVLRGEENGKFKNTPLVEKYRDEGEKLYKADKDRVKYTFNYELFLPYFYLAFIQTIIGLGIYSTISLDAFVYWVSSTATSVMMIALYMVYTEDEVRQVYYDDSSEDEEDKKMSISEIVSRS